MTIYNLAKAVQIDMNYGWIMQVKEIDLEHLVAKKLSRTTGHQFSK